MGEAKRRPGVTGYWLAAIIAVVGVAIAVVAGVGAIRSIMGVSSGLDRFIAPGTTTLTLEEAGGYKVYHEHVSFFQGQTFNNPAGPPPNMVLSVTRASTDAAIASGPAMSETYTLGNAQGTAVWQFSVSEPGDYVISVLPADTGPEPAVIRQQYVMAVGRGVLGGIFMGVGGIFCAIASAGLGLLIAFVLALVTFLRRRSSAATPATAA
jgi:hypothetical protein